MGNLFSQPDPTLNPKVDLINNTFLNRTIPAHWQDLPIQTFSNIPAPWNISVREEIFPIPSDSTDEKLKETITPPLLGFQNPIFLNYYLDTSTPNAARFCIAATEGNRKEVINTASEKPSLLNQKTTQGFTILHCAAWGGDLETFEWLLGALD